MNIPETELAWMAGFFDGEGSIMLSKVVNDNGGVCFHRRVCVVNTRRDILDIFQRYFGGTIRENTHQTKYNPNAKPIYSWECSTKQSAYFVGMIKPYLRLKSYQADLFMDFDVLVNNYNLVGRHRNNGRFSELDKQAIETRTCIVNAIKRVNHRGKLCLLE